MFKPSEIILWKLNQTTTFYKDSNNNLILDSQDTVVAKVENVTKDVDSFDKLSKELSGKTGSGTVYIENSYHLGTKTIALTSYNSYLLYSTFIDIFAICLVWFLLWFVLFPKRIKQ